jgi:hypothetical protein
MGHTGDTRFVSFLGQMVTDKDPRVRTRVFAALAVLKAARERQASAQALGLTALPQPIPGAFSLTVRVKDCEGAGVSGLLPTAFALTIHGIPVLDYDVCECDLRGGAAYEIHWEPPDPEHAWPLQICACAEACHGVLAVECAVSVR